MNVLYGEETKRALANFGFGPLPVELIRAYAKVKKACLTAIQETEQRFESGVWTAIASAADEIIAGLHDDQFPLNLMQGGAGTSINMCVNEVLARRAMDVYRERASAGIVIDPIEDINRYQSTNDTFPTAVTIIMLEKLTVIESCVIRLQEKLAAMEERWSGIAITGRTEMQAALPISLGQVFGAWAGAIERDRWRLHKLKDRIRTIALGGTAIGTCFSAPERYIFAAEKALRAVTALPLARSQNLPDEISNQDKFAELANGFSLVATNLIKITNDCFYYTSSDIGEMVHPELQYGSTIMAAKINPVMLEYVSGLAIDAHCECGKIVRYAQEGMLQLNAYLPFMLNAFLAASGSLEKALDALAGKFFANVRINAKRIGRNLLSSRVLFNLLVPVLGYHRVKTLAGEVAGTSFETIDRFVAYVAEQTGLDSTALSDFFDRYRTPEEHNESDT